MLEGIVRDSIGKKAAKALKRDGYLLANIYGKGAQNVNAAFKRNDFIRAVKKKDTLVFSVKVADNEYNVVIQEYQRDPITSDITHVDLRLVVPNEVTSYLVPVKTVGTPKGLKNKGVLIISKKRLKVKCSAENLPDSFVLDVANLDVGDSILVRNIKTSDDVKFMVNDSVAVAGVIKAK